MRPGVRQLNREPVAVLHAHTRLQGVIGKIGLVLFYGDAGEAGKNPGEIRIRLASRDKLPISYIAQRQSVDRAVVALIPTPGADILHHGHNGGCDLPLNSETKHRRPRWSI